MNKRGFTLVELLATITILGIIMAVAVPNVISIVDKNKRTTYIADAKKLVALAEYKLRTDVNQKKPDGTTSVIYRFNELDTSDLLDPAPEGGTYDGILSYVEIKYNTTYKEYQYYVQLVENTTSGNQRGIKYAISTELDKDNANMTLVQSNLDVGFVVQNYTYKKCRDALDLLKNKKVIVKNYVTQTIIPNEDCYQSSYWVCDQDPNENSISSSNSTVTLYVK